MPSCSENGNSTPCSAAYWQAALHVVQKRSQALFDALIKRAVERQVQKRCLARHALQTQHDVGVLVHRRHRHNAVGPSGRLHCLLRTDTARSRLQTDPARRLQSAKLRMVRRIGGPYHPTRQPLAASCRQAAQAPRATGLVAACAVPLPNSGSASTAALTSSGSVASCGCAAACSCEPSQPPSA